MLPATTVAAPPTSPGLVQSDSQDSVYELYRELMDKSFGDDCHAKCSALLIALSLQSRLLRETLTAMQLPRRKVSQARKLEAKILEVGNGLAVGA